MDEKQGSQGKPLRAAPNKLKDLYNTYLKNDDKKSNRIISDDSKLKSGEEEIEELKKLLNEEIQVENGKNTVSLKEDELLEILNIFEGIEKERDDIKDQLARRTAELENVRRRTIREKQEMVDYANERLLFKLLSLADDFDIALESAKKSSDYDALLKGVELIKAKMLKIFEEAGVKKMDSAVGNPFNVDFHEALMHIPSESPEGSVIQEVQAGYMIHNKVLRHTKVVTSAGNPG